MTHDDQTARQALLDAINEHFNATDYNGADKIAADFLRVFAERGLVLTAASLTPDAARKIIADFLLAQHPDDYDGSPGCPHKNAHKDADALLEIFRQAGFVVKSAAEMADLYEKNSRLRATLLGMIAVMEPHASGGVLADIERLRQTLRQTVI